ncbi:MAG: MBL fold metallo-hydrolase [Methanomicrobium sp.]|nr:MBL fold metallo-hydrolase [Methanomicrobium sp.]
MMFTVTEVYNNAGNKPDVIFDFGFACFIKEAGILFDTGAKEDVLRKNMSLLGINPDEIKAVFLSHDHWDHNGGAGILKGLSSSIKSYALESFSDETLDLLSKNTDLNIVSGWEEIMSGFFSTGPLGDDIIEQSLAIKKDSGFVVIAGCSHPHIKNILSFVRERGDVSGLIGGLHDVSDEDIKSLSKIPYLAPSHCTKRLDEIKESYPDNFREGGAGVTHNFS